MDSRQWTGDDERNLSSNPRTVPQEFWRAFAYAKRTGALAEFFAIYEPLKCFATLVCEAHAKLQAERTVREWQETADPDLVEMLELKGML